MKVTKLGGVALGPGCPEQELGGRLACVVAEDRLEHERQKALAVAARAPPQGQDVLAHVAGEGVAEEVVEEPHERRVAGQHLG